MNTKALLFSILISGFCLCGLKEDYPRIRKMCNFIGSPRLYLIMDKQPIKWNLQKNMKFDEVLGSGSSGVVAPASFDGSMIPTSSFYADKRDITEVAIKRMELNEYTLNELQIMKLMTETRTGLRLYGCQLQIPEDEYEASLRGERPMIYIVMDRLNGDLTNEEVLKKIHKNNNKGRFRYYQSLFEQAIAFVKKGYVINDIKPENMLYDKKNDNILLIDFGLAQQIGTTLMFGGTRPFMCPGKFRSPRPAAHMITDLYSLVLTIATIEEKDDLNILYYDIEKKVSQMDCQKSKNDVCRDFLRGRIVGALAAKGWAAKKIGKTAKGTNFLGLVDLILAYDNFPYSTEEVLAIIENEYPEPLTANKPNLTKPVQEHYTATILRHRIQKQKDEEAEQKPAKKEKDRGCNFFGFFAKIFS